MPRAPVVFWSPDMNDRPKNTEVRGVNADGHLILWDREHLKEHPQS